MLVCSQHRRGSDHRAPAPWSLSQVHFTFTCKLGTPTMAHVLYEALGCPRVGAAVRIRALASRLALTHAIASDPIHTETRKKLRSCCVERLPAHGSDP